MSREKRQKAADLLEDMIIVTGVKDAEAAKIKAAIIGKLREEPKRARKRRSPQA